MSATELHWFKSSHSDSSEPGDCVEVATTPTTIHVRDSKTPDTQRLAVAPATWTRFLTYVSE
ncbi:DUF397 domain-containing protein [Streptomyces sp. Li-HN-5-11]|uniref:DUF397 domain-containing protein n=1 Tax=Streptomyces sp. Li-HN-5-11 TaxID=3075432 RepID=UPI0028A76D33|nr:DUF397 domain-containing protein [Streptomyces sp. Li-HN-5-11]WNM35665.1 DUF397 domain-containing protein [Streptomyces sp. Li-HN-5-11]